MAQEGLCRRRSQGHAVVTEDGLLTRGALRMGFSRTFFFGGRGGSLHSISSLVTRKDE